MNNKTLFVITEKSEMERWDIARRKININQAMLDGLTANLIRTVRGVMPMNAIVKDSPGFADIAIGPSGYSVTRMPIYDLPLTAPYAIEGATTFPAFDGPHPVSAQVWHVPSTMNLYLCAHCSNSFECIEQHLVAIDSERRMWRLPLSNLYADCRLCAGRFSASGDSLMTICQRVMVQFQNSNWNQDLYNDATALRRNCTKALFTFDVSNEKITQRTPPKNWQSLCEKASTDFLIKYVNY